MSKKSKLIIVICAIAVLVVSSVVATCIIVFKKDEPPESPPVEPEKVVGLIDNGTKENLNLSFISEGDKFKGETVQKVYEFTFENNSINDWVLNSTEAIVANNITLTYYYSNEKISEYQSLQGSGANKVDVRRGTTLYVYLIAKVEDTTKDGSCLGSVNFDTDKIIELTFKVEDGEDVKATLLEGSVVSNDIIPELPSGVLGYSYTGWFTDSDCEEVADFDLGFSENTTLYSKKTCESTDWIAYDSTKMCYYIKTGTSTLPAYLTIPSSYNDGLNGWADVGYIKEGCIEENSMGPRPYAYAFVNNQDIVSVTLPSSITELSTFAFFNCPNLKEVNFGTGKELTIGTDAFYSCSSLESIYISKRVKKIFGRAFNSCALTSVYFEDVTTWYSGDVGIVDSEILTNPSSAVLLLDYALVYEDEPSMVTMNANGGEMQNLLADEYSYGKGEVTSSTEITNIVNIEAEGNCGFEVNADGYYESGKSSSTDSFALCKLTFYAEAGDEVVFDVKFASSADNWAIYGLFGRLNDELSAEYGYDTYTANPVYKCYHQKVSLLEDNAVYSITETGEYTIYVKFTSNPVTSKENYALQFKAYLNKYEDDESIVKTFIDDGNEVGTLPTPTREGYTFVGWYTEIDGGILVTEEMLINMPTTIYAHWEEN